MTTMTAMTDSWLIALILLTPLGAGLLALALHRRPGLRELATLGSCLVLFGLILALAAQAAHPTPQAAHPAPRAAASLPRPLAVALLLFGAGNLFLGVNTRWSAGIAEQIAGQLLLLP